MIREFLVFQSVEQRTVNAVAVQKKVLENTAEICGFFNACLPNTGINFWKKESVFYAIYGYLLPFFVKSYTLTYGSPRHTFLHT